MWDADVFSETIPTTERIRTLYESNRDIIFNLGCTPEVWMIEKLESYDPEIVNALRDRFRYEVATVITSSQYVGCNSPKPRKLAKQKMDVVISQFSAACGDSEEIVRDAFADILIETAYDISAIRRIVCPILARIQ